ncbi:MAG: hypothetical protein J0H16_08750 [Alicycliphilus denitrificans]|nr:hypothetical protein [Alicycliphilus denitrificans]OJW89045.1 MAG: hypothetical protein BGO66_02135 [Alicycliphilus sp. 69-12]
MRITPFLIAASACLISACAQNHSKTACPTAAQMEQPELVGRWQADMPGQSGPIVLELGPHPEWDGTVKGHILRPGSSAVVVGDVNRGELTLEESRDGRKVTGNWFGQVVEGSCAREIRGEWTDEADRPYAFTLRKIGGPQP